MSTIAQRARQPLTTGNTFTTTLALTHRLHDVQARALANGRIEFTLLRDAGANLLAGVQGCPDHADSRTMARLHAGGTATVLATFFWGWETIATRCR